MFLEERATEKLLYGSSFNEKYEVDMTTTRSGNDYPRRLSPYPRLRYTINLLDEQDTIIQSALDLFHRSGGTSGGFRVKHHREYSTNNYTQAPTFNDQAALIISDGVYQIIRWYRDEGSLDAPRRRVLKPVGSVLVGIRDESANAVQQVNGWTADNTNGRITFAANKSYAVTGITQAANAVVTIGSNTLAIDDTVHFSAVVGMTEINGLRGKVLVPGATTVTVDIDTSAFTAYASGGAVNTRPQANEIVTTGCEFDIPCRFETDLSDITFASFQVLATSIQIVEQLNPS